MERTNTAQKKNAAFQREAMRIKRKTLTVRAETFFTHYSSDAQTIEEIQVPEFLSQVVEKDLKDMEPDAVELVIKYAQNIQNPLTPSGYIERKPFLKTVDKFADFIARSATINNVFDEFDVNKDGLLCRGELVKMLQNIEAFTERKTIDGVVIRLDVFDDDIDFILEQSDQDGDGKISKIEVLAALGAWEGLALCKIDAVSKGCCVIM